MSRKAKTLEDFLPRYVIRHNSEYDYSESLYVNNKTKIKIICKRHGAFYQRPSDHLNNGCPKCGNENCLSHQPKTTEKFIEDAKKEHGETYEYSRVIYTLSENYVTITCKVHGDFDQKANNHLRGNGCPRCFSDLCRKDNEAYKQECSAMHNGKYDYSLTVYKGNQKKVDIICPLHGLFSQNAGNHLRGTDCPKCARGGYRVNKPSSIYMLKSGDITKVGITNLSAKKRCRETSFHSGMKFEVAFVITFDNGQIPLDIETMILKELREQYKGLESSFTGSTECFFYVDRLKLQTRLLELANNFSENILNKGNTA